MKYLLSSGATTENPVSYIKDIIKMNMLLLPDEIPYFKGGSNELIQDILEVNLVSHITTEVNKIISRIKSSFSDVSISLDSIVRSESIVTVKIRIDNIVETYEIKRFNQERIN